MKLPFRSCLALLLAMALSACSDAPDPAPEWRPLAAELHPEPPPRRELRKLKRAGLLDDLGQALDGRWQIRLGQLQCEAVVLLPDRPQTLSCDLSRVRSLRFDAWSECAPDQSLELVVQIDGHSELRSGFPRGQHHPMELALPAAGPDSRLTLRVEGELGFLALRNATLGPESLGDYGQRPWRARPDIVFLMADTFRADNLEIGGGDPELAPHLNAWAQQCLTFTEARAPATWTLPSHAAIFSARYPSEVGVLGSMSRMAEDTPTLARHLRTLGYRTAAVTDGGFVSARFGMDQGFEWFEELGGKMQSDPAATEAAVQRVLARDDGRPLFLFVQSYRAHSWIVDDETRQRLGERYAFQPNGIFGSPQWKARFLDLLRDAPHGVPMEGAEFDEVVGAMIPNYRGASADTDRSFGRLLELLRQRQILSSGVVAFTSDHGEALGDHGVVSHGNGVWDGQAKVPLILSRAGLEPGVDRRPVSPIDLPRTLCSLAGLEPHPDWGGVDLTQAWNQARPLAVFQTLQAKQRYLAVVQDGWKWIFLDENGPGDLVFAYDLETDPEERHNLAPGLDQDPRALAAKAWIQELYAKPQKSTDAVLSTEEAERIRALGYGTGGDDDD